MKEVILWGCGNIGRKAYEKLSREYEIIAYVDNDRYKQNLIYKRIPIISFEKLKSDYFKHEVIVSVSDYYDIAKWLDEHNISVIGYYDEIQEKVLPWRKISWEDIKNKKIRLYAGDIYNNFEYYPDDYVICLSLSKSDYRTIRHDISEPYPLKDETIDSYQIEDVIEHIEKKKALIIINEIYRILKKGGYLRLSLPDYYSSILIERSLTDKFGKIVYDPYGGGNYIEGKVCNGGHLWFPTYELVQRILEESDFKKYKFYRYHDRCGNTYSEEIDYRMGYVSRTKEHTSCNKDISIVVDCFK